MYKISEDEGATWSEPIRLPDNILGPIKNKPINLSNNRIVSPSSTENQDVWHAHLEISDDDGLTWKKVQLDTTTGYKLIQPTLITLQEGTVLALMRSDQNRVVASESEDGGEHWSIPHKTEIVHPNSGIDAVTLDNGFHLLVNNPLPSGQDWFNGRNRLDLLISKNGLDWTVLMELENEVQGEYSYPAIIQSKDGLIHISYTYDRKNIKYVVLQMQ